MRTSCNPIVVASLVVLSLKYVLGDSCSYSYFNSTTKKDYVLDMSCLYDITFDYFDAPYHFLYTPCHNGDHCLNDQTEIAGMTVQYDPDQDNPQCFLISKWDNSGIASYQSGVWTVEFQNGDDCFGTPRVFYAVLICDPTTDGITTGVNEPRTCEYAMEIRTKYACTDYNESCSTTTSTTEIPIGGCEYYSPDDQHILNISSIQGQSISTVSNTDPELFYVYTPCTNSYLCNNELVMAWSLNITSFSCEQYYAIWEDGNIQPEYDEVNKEWQFLYANGEKCDNGFDSVFEVVWVCDSTKKTPQVVEFGENGDCMFEMRINSTLACN